MFSKLQYISQGETAAMQLKNINEALDAGCNWVQLRFKNAKENELKTTAEEIKKLCETYTATFIINDHPVIAKEVDADGVHLGLTDMKISEAKNIIGANKILGGTANTLQDVLQRVEEGCNYVGLGPLRFTTTKARLSPVLGLDGYKNIIDELKQRNIELPVYAIGGILAEDISSILQTGIYGVAVSGIITHHPNKKELVGEINAYIL
ncbi:MAG: thiamine phosphate synthase [Ferruginibacter sp.]|nr:thiamine phosphate synthase [Ferruginibacter sp.]